MKTSTRNQFLGKVTNVKRGAVNDEIGLEVVGAKAKGMFKASSVILGIPA